MEVVGVCSWMGYGSCGWGCMKYMSLRKALYRAGRCAKSEMGKEPSEMRSETS